MHCVVPPVPLVLHCCRRAMVKSATEAGSVPTFHYMDEVNVDELLGLRALLKDDPTLEGKRFSGATTCLYTHC